MKNLNNKKFLGAVALGAFLVTGFYNAIVLNSESHVQSASFSKRLDEVYGITVQGRQLASTATWHKVSVSPVKPVVVINPEFAPTQNSVAAVVEAPAEAAIREDLSLGLIEVVNAQKWSKGLGTSQFSGNLVANNGTIEALDVALPDGLGISVKFSELNGNVFEYELEGQQFSGMLYQVDANSFMVTLTNGPLEGTRMRFGGEPVVENQEQIASTLAENHQVEVGTFGATEIPVVENDAPEASIQAATFNFDAGAI